MRKEWPRHCLLVEQLQSSVVDYLIHCHVISKQQRDLYIVTEGELILNRLARVVDTEHSSLKICPTHRFTYGVGRSIPTGCSWYDHSSGICRLACDRVAPMHLAKMVSSFPYAGRICSKHRNILYRREQQTEIGSEPISNAHSWELIHHDIGAVNGLLERLNESPIRSQANRIPIETQAAGSKGRLISKLRRLASIEIIFEGGLISTRSLPLLRISLDECRFLILISLIERLLISSGH